jgi:hypothetical protein
VTSEPRVAIFIDQPADETDAEIEHLVPLLVEAG